MNHSYTTARRFACLAGAFAFLLAASCISNSKADTGASETETETATANSLADEHYFNDVLEKNMLPAVYHFDGRELQKQQQYPSKLTADAAFEQGVKSLFALSSKNAEDDSFHKIVLDNPVNYGLSEQANPSEIKRVIREQLLQDHSFEIILLPENLAHDGQTFTAPKNGEKTMDYWIWYVKADDFFAGPAWILVKRDGSEPAYHYGHLEARSK